MGGKESTVREKRDGNRGEEKDKKGTYRTMKVGGGIAGETYHTPRHLRCNAQRSLGIFPSVPSADIQHFPCV